MHRGVKILYKLIKISLIIFVFTLLFDFVYTNFIKIVFPYNFTDNTKNSKLKIKTFKPNIDSSYYSQINGKIRFCTSKNGYRIKCNKKIKDKNYNFIFLGNIFTEGKHLNYDETFFGMIELNNPNLSFANLGASSMQVEDYYNIISQIINNNTLQFEHVVIYLDQSNFQIPILKKNTFNKKKNFFKIKNFLRNNFYTYFRLYRFSLYKLNRGKLWAYSPSNHYNYWNQKDFGSIVEIHAKQIKTLNEIYSLLQSNNKKFSIGIYPYPYDFLYQKEKSNFNKLIDNFCHTNCDNYFNSFPIFYQNYEKKNNWNFIDKYFLKYSVHHNKNGNFLIMKNFNNIIKKK